MNEHHQDLKFLGIIPARAGSKGLPKKNMLKLGDNTLLGHAVENARKSKYLTRVVVSADSDELMEEGARNKAEVLFKRPAELATDTASSWSVVQHTVQWLEDNEQWLPDYVVLLQPTTPFRTAEHIDQTIENMLLNSRKSALSVRETDYPPHWMFYIDENGQGTRLFPEGAKITRRQDAPVVWQPNGLVYVISRDLLIENPTLPKENSYFYKMDWRDSVNIDEQWQYELAKSFWPDNK